MEWQHIALIIGVGIIAGFINTLAGSGSLLTLPILMFLGLPANVANGTNRVAIFFQSLVSVRNFRKHKIFTLKEGMAIGLPAVVGSLVGANIALSFDESVMRKAIGLLLVLMVILTVLKPEKFIKKQEAKEKKFGLLQIVIFFLIGVYGGFIQAGVGLFLLAGLVLGCGFELVKANAIKNFIVLFYTPFALAVFIINGQVDYLYGFILTIGNVIGAYSASMLAIQKGAVFVRYFLIVALIASSLKLFGLF
jgi:uncharacterized protein